MQEREQSLDLNLPRISFPCGVAIYAFSTQLELETFNLSFPSSASISMSI